MGNTDDVLFDDGAFVQGFGDIMVGRADDFHFLVEGLFVRVSTHESRQKGMADWANIRLSFK